MFATVITYFTYDLKFKNISKDAILVLLDKKGPQNFPTDCSIKPWRWLQLHLSPPLRSPMRPWGPAFLISSLCLWAWTGSQPATTASSTAQHLQSVPHGRAHEPEPRHATPPIINRHHPIRALIAGLVAVSAPTPNTCGWIALNQASHGPWWWRSVYSCAGVSLQVFTSRNDLYAHRNKK